MIVNRKGTKANHGIKSIELNDPRISWDQGRKSVIVSVSQIQGFPTKNGKKKKAAHDYKLELNLTDLALIIKTVGDETSSQSTDAIAEAFQPILREIIRLQHICAGVTVNNTMKHKD